MSNGKHAVLFLIFCVLLVVGVGYSWKQVQEGLREPYRYDIPEDEASPRWSDSYDRETLRAIRLKTIDTDKDGLSNYDELYVYNTSPYLEDTDSDSILDKKEIEQNSDPNCPKGQTCFSPEVSDSGASIPIFQDLPLSGTGSAEERALAGTATPDEIREILLQAGMSKEEVEQLSDETIKELYLESVEESDVSPSGSVSMDDMRSYIEGLSADEIKVLLKESGATDEMLETIDSATLKQILLESMSD